MQQEIREPPPAAVPRVRQLDCSRNRQELTERYNIDVGSFIEPLAPLHELGAQIAKMSDRATETGESQAKENEQPFEGGAPSRADNRVAVLMVWAVARR
jgi:hypothetical protein